MTKDSHQVADRAPAPGSLGFEEYVDEQGQRAMDQALAMPLVRVFFGLLWICNLALCVQILVTAIWQRDWLSGAIALLFVPLIRELGSVCFLGRSRTPWFREIMSGYRCRKH